MTVWTPSTALVDDVRHALAHAPRDTPEARFEAWAWRAMLDEEGSALLTKPAAPAHLTASAIVLSSDLSRTVLVLHGRMRRWVQPGGHLEPGDVTASGAAAREVAEETGLTVAVQPVPVILSRHPAPCRPGVVDWHLDLQYVAVVEDLQALQLSDESLDLSWFGVNDLPGDIAPGLDASIAAAVAAVQESRRIA